MIVVGTSSWTKLQQILDCVFIHSLIFARRDLEGVGEWQTWSAKYFLDTSAEYFQI